MKNFWESRTLFIKRVLAAGGKVGGGFRSTKVIDFFHDLWYPMTLIRGRTLLIEQPLEKKLNELNAGRCNEKAAAVENDTQWRKPVQKGAGQRDLRAKLTTRPSDFESRFFKKVDKYRKKDYYIKAR